MFDSTSSRPAESRAAALLAEACATPPGPLAITLLAQVDPAELEPFDRVEALQAWERNARWLAARQSEVVVAVAGAAPDGADDFGREQVRVALAGVGGPPRGLVDLGRALAGPLAPAHRAMVDGDLSLDHARVLARETEHLDDRAARTVCAHVLPVGRATPSEFRRRVRRWVIKVDPLRAELAATRAAQERHVARRVEPDAQATLYVTGPAVDVQTIWTALDLRAGHRSGDDPRNLDQRRFDSLVQLCRDAVAAGPAGGGAADGREPVGSATRWTRRGLRPAVYLFADAPTWAGLADEPVELAGYGPVPAGVAREHFSDSCWRAVVTDTVSAAPLAVSDRSYTPSARTNRHLHVQDRRCGFPGCLAAVWFCDADHNVPHDQGGCTDTTNCGLLCRRHHRLKTFTAWSWVRSPDGSIEWTDPTGHRWAREPVRYRLPVPGPP